MGISLKVVSQAERRMAAINKAAYRAINKVAAKAFTRSRREISARVMLTPAYVRDRMELKKATPSKSEAIIVARARPTRLATYGAKQLIRAAPKKRKKGDKRWGVHAGSGDSLRGIPKGKVPAGASVKVKRGGSRKQMRGAFFMPLRAGLVAGGNSMGVFIRVGDGRKAIKHLYGPSVDQVFRGVIDDIKGDVTRDLHATMASQAVFEIKAGVKK